MSWKGNESPLQVGRLCRGSGVLRPLSPEGPSHTPGYTWKLSKASVVPRKESSREGLLASASPSVKTSLPQKVG